MKLIFIRHGDPDYANDSLTPKGEKEARALAERVKNWKNIYEFYLSPLGRAQKTASYSLDALNRQGKTLPWLKEFSHDVTSPGRGFKHVPWDFFPSFWKNEETLYDRNNWADDPIYENTPVKKDYLNTIGEFDKLMAQYGYTRGENGLYRIEKENDDTTLVFFCHLGVSFLLIGHLIGISPAVLWHTYFVAPTAVTVVGSEEMEKGYANFRVQVMGDTSHLRFAGEPVSSSGYFTDTFQD